MTQKLKLAMLISGGGTTFLNLHEEIQAGRLEAEIVCVISSASKAKGLERARELGYPALFLGRGSYPDDSSYSAALTAAMLSHGAELAILAGFLKRYLPGDRFVGKTLNIHPSLIPAFCGHGYYGMAVHEAVWQRGCKVSGCTVHLVNDEYDAGPIVLQKVVAIEGQDSPEDIRRKVFEAEKQAYPEAIRYFCENQISFDGPRSIIANK